MPPPSKRPAASLMTASSKMTRGRHAAAVARTPRSGAKGASSSRAHSAGSSDDSNEEAGVGDAVVAPIFAGIESEGQAAFQVTSKKVGARGGTDLGVQFLGSDNPELAEVLADDVAEGAVCVHLCTDSRCPKDDPATATFHLSAYEEDGETFLVVQLWHRTTLSCWRFWRTIRLRVPCAYTCVQAERRVVNSPGAGPHRLRLRLPGMRTGVSPRTKGRTRAHRA
jgi:hypothetical protein